MQTVVCQSATSYHSHIFCQWTCSNGTCLVSVLPKVIQSPLLPARSHAGWDSYWPGGQWSRSRAQSTSTVFGSCWKGQRAPLVLSSLLLTPWGTRCPAGSLLDPWLFCVPLAIGYTRVVKGKVNELNWNWLLWRSLEKYLKKEKQ